MKKAEKRIKKCEEKKNTLKNEEEYNTEKNIFLSSFLLLDIFIYMAIFKWWWRVGQLNDFSCNSVFLFSYVQFIYKNFAA